jgi:hypothetical protein
MTPSELIDKQIADLGDWRGVQVAKPRRLINETDPEIKEEWKWETAVWSHGGMLCAVGAFKDHVKMNFFKGAALQDPHKLCNADLDAKKTRAIDIYHGDDVNESALKQLLLSAVARNTAG